MPSQPFKRICIFSDGTWNDPETPNPTNIFTLATSISLFDADNISQLVFYDAGVGAGGNLGHLIAAGAFGAGVDTNIQELYTALAMNYSTGDEVYLFGYSRGAYTVRSLAGMINKSGLVRRDELEWVKEAYDLYRNHDVSADSETAIRFRDTHGDRIPIKCLVCFDTVGTLGIPETYPFPLRIFSDAHRYRFHDTTLSGAIENAVHMLSIDEDRESFRPTLMQPHPSRGDTQLTQKFFPGGHSGVGGGSQHEQMLSDNTLVFAVNEMKRRMLGLSFDEDRLPSAPNNPNVPPRPRSLVSIFGGIIRLITGVYVRVIDRIEDIHESALERYRNVREWRPPALERFKQAIVNAT